MRPIDHKVDISLCQALSCAEFRFPKVAGLSVHAAELTLGLRYSLIGLAAHSYILSGCDSTERENLIKQLRFFGTMIRESIEQDMVVNPRHALSPNQPAVAQSVYRQLFERYCDLFRLNCSIDMILSVLVEEFAISHSREAKTRLFSFVGRKARRAFEVEAQKSLKFALCFYERRKYDLEELPEIALLDE